MAELVRSIIISAEKGAGLGAYVQVFQRPGEPVLADLNFFEGTRSVEEMKELRRVLDQAIAESEAWVVRKKLEGRPKERQLIGEFFDYFNDPISPGDMVITVGTARHMKGIVEGFYAAPYTGKPRARIVSPDQNKKSGRMIYPSKLIKLMPSKRGAR